MCLTAAAQHVPALADAARKTAQTAATAQYGAEHAGVPHKHNLPLKVAVTAAHRQEPALLHAAAALAAHGVHARGRLALRQANPRQVKPAAIAVPEQEQ